MTKPDTFAIRDSYRIRKWHEIKYNNGIAYLHFYFETILKGSTGEQAMYLFAVFNSMKQEDKKCYCMLASSKAYYDSSFDLFPILDTLQRIDAYFFGLLRMMMITKVPDLPKLPLPPLYPTPFAGTQTPAMGTLVIPPLTGNRTPTTIPGMPIPLHEDALDESDPNIQPVSKSGFDIGNNLFPRKDRANGE